MWKKKSEFSANETLLPIVKYTHYLINYAKISSFNPHKLKRNKVLLSCCVLLYSLLQRQSSISYTMWNFYSTRFWWCQFSRLIYPLRSYIKIYSFNRDFSTFMGSLDQLDENGVPLTIHTLDLINQKWTKLEGKFMRFIESSNYFI